MLINILKIKVSIFEVLLFMTILVSIVIFVNYQLKLKIKYSLEKEEDVINKKRLIVSEFMGNVLIGIIIPVFSILLGFRINSWVEDYRECEVFIGKCDNTIIQNYYFIDDIEMYFDESDGMHRFYNSLYYKIDYKNILKSIRDFNTLPEIYKYIADEKVIRALQHNSLILDKYNDTIEIFMSNPNRANEESVKRINELLYKNLFGLLYIRSEVKKINGANKIIDTLRDVVKESGKYQMNIFINIFNMTVDDWIIQCQF